jgi:oligopeptide/dipeptide ABC transporter ATP-binding protein
MSELGDSRTTERAPSDARAGSSTDGLAVMEHVVKHFPVQGPRRIGAEREVVHAVDDVSLSVRRGETLGVVGESGSGKSTLARCLLGLYPVTSGKVLFDGEEISSLSARRLRHSRRDMQMVFQDPYGALNPRRRVGSIIADPLAIHTRDSRADRRLRVQELMELVGLNPEHYNRFPNEFSGGQRQRIGVARALAMRPKLIVCDEPVSSLDVSIQAQILNLLIDLQSELGLTYVFIAHDLSVIRHVSDWVDVMYLGKIVERGPVADLFHSPRHPYTAALLAAIPVPDPDYVDHKRRVVLTGDLPSPIHPPPGCRFSSRCPRATDRCRSEEPMLEPRLSDNAQHLTACHFPLADGEILASADTINLEAAPAVYAAGSGATEGTATQGVEERR